MKFATTKQRIVQYIENKGIGVKEFLEKTEIKRGFLDSDKLESTVSDVFITKIIAKYSDINIEWLLTGNGSMLKSEVKRGLGQNITGDSNIQSGNSTTVANDTNAVQECKKKVQRLENELKECKIKLDAKENQVSQLINTVTALSQPKETK